ncbi:MAG: hydrogenase expression/formation protein HypE [Isosphaeraceae bacterium]|nr:hydrogenase expression/formation protein HypE [Isosphaeraceae bacterium]
MESSCPTPLGASDRVLLAHGEGALWSRRLIREVFVRAFGGSEHDPLLDGAVLPPCDRPIVATTDSYVISPLFFPGGDIGSLAVHGTLNDLAVMGADPIGLTSAWILEEGLPLETLRRVVDSMAAAARAAGVRIVAGDTKVVPRGAADGLFINTTGLGRLRPDARLGPERIAPGDRVVVSGTLGDHGIAVLSARSGITFETEILSDSCNLHPLISDLLDSGLEIRFLRDATRGGLAAVLHEITETGSYSIEIEESRLPVSSQVRGACELLGLDPVHIANEGKFVAVVAEADAEAVVNRLRASAFGRDAAIVGSVIATGPARVSVRGRFHVVRELDEPTGAPMPRIC